MTYYYEFTLDGNVIGYTKQTYDKKLLPMLNDKHVKQTVKDNFCNKYGLNHDKVEVELCSATRAKDISHILTFDFKYNGR